MQFTDKYIKSLKPKVKMQDVREGNGFGIRVFPSGEKSWFFRYHFEGRKRYLNLGRYREDGSGVSLSDARRKHRDALNLLENGKDPAEVAEQAKHERRNAPTISDLVDEYLNRHAKKFKRSWQEDERILNRDIIPAWGKRKAADIKKRDINLLLESIVDRGAPVMANNTFKIVRRMFNYAVEKDILPFAPSFGIKLPAPKVERERALGENEVKALWHSLDTASMSDEIRRALKLILVTAQRPNEVIGMHTSEIDGHWWTIPSERAKNGKTHRVYLTKTALELVGELEITDMITGITKPRGYIFPCPHLGKDKSINRHALSRAVVNNCPSGCINGCEKCENTECKEDGRKLEEKNKLGVVHFTPHDLRRTAATFMAKSGELDEVIDAVLNHVKQGVIKVYNQYRYDKEKQLALEAWERKLTAIVSGNETGKVLLLKRRSRT